MSWLLFIDVSVHDRGASPYEVLAGVAIQDRTVREVIAQLHEAETRWFGRRELKGKVLLKRKVFRHSSCTATSPRACRSPILSPA